MSLSIVVAYCIALSYAFIYLFLKLNGKRHPGNRGLGYSGEKSGCSDLHQKTEMNHMGSLYSSSCTSHGLKKSKQNMQNINHKS